jgi:hypothetical protein
MPYNPRKITQFVDICPDYVKGSQYLFDFKISPAANADPSKIKIITKQLPCYDQMEIELSKKYHPRATPCAKEPPSKRLRF